ncbi:hypothetical protein YC2023_121594 [Brassica napus]
MGVYSSGGLRVGDSNLRSSSRTTAPPVCGLSSCCRCGNFKRARCSVVSFLGLSRLSLWELAAIGVSLLSFHSLGASSLRYLHGRDSNPDGFTLLDFYPQINYHQTTSPS